MQVKTESSIDNPPFRLPKVALPRIASGPDAAGLKAVYPMSSALVPPERCARNTARGMTSSGYNTARNAGVAR